MRGCDLERRGRPLDIVEHVLDVRPARGGVNLLERRGLVMANVKLQ